MRTDCIYHFTNGNSGKISSSGIFNDRDINRLISCIIRGNNVIIPGGRDVILPGDSVIVVTVNHKLNDLDDILK